MKNKKIRIEKTNLSGMPSSELQLLYRKLCEEYRVLRFDRILGTVGNLKIFSDFRKQIARVSNLLSR